MDAITIVVWTVIALSIGLAKSNRKTPRFERREKREATEGFAINWLTVPVGSRLVVNLKNFIIAPARVLREAGWLVPDRFVEARDGNDWGAIIEVEQEVKGTYPWTQALCTQLSLVEALSVIAEGFERLGGCVFEPRSLVDTGDADAWVFDRMPTVIITHEMTGNGNRSEYAVVAPDLPDPEQLILLDLEDTSDENTGGAE